MMRNRALRFAGSTSAAAVVVCLLFVPSVEGKSAGESPEEATGGPIARMTARGLEYRVYSAETGKVVTRVKADAARSSGKAYRLYSLSKVRPGAVFEAALEGERGTVEVEAEAAEYDELTDTGRLEGRTHTYWTSIPYGGLVSSAHMESTGADFRGAEAKRAAKLTIGSAVRCDYKSPQWSSWALMRAAGASAELKAGEVFFRGPVEAEFPGEVVRLLSLAPTEAERPAADGETPKETTSLTIKLSCRGETAFQLPGRNTAGYLTFQSSVRAETEEWRIDCDRMNVVLPALRDVDSEKAGSRNSVGKIEVSGGVQCVFHGLEIACDRLVYSPKDALAVLTRSGRFMTFRTERAELTALRATIDMSEGILIAESGDSVTTLKIRLPVEETAGEAPEQE